MSTPYQPGPYPPPPGPPNWQPPAGPPPRRKNKWLLPVLLGVAAVVVLCCGVPLAVGLVAGDDKPDKTAAEASSAPAAADPDLSSSAPAPAKTSAKPAPEKPKGYSIGDAVRGGDFEFTVHGVKCGITKVGSQYLNTKPQGMFCRADITAKNVTKSAHMFHADGSITALDAGSREYSVDGEAGIYGNEDAKGFLDEINPGNSVRANVYFDVPKGTKLTKLVFDAGLLTLARDAVVNL